MSDVKYNLNIQVTRKEYVLMRQALLMAAWGIEDDHDHEDTQMLLCLCKHLRDQFTVSFGQNDIAKKD